MSRMYVVQSWSGAAEYSGEQIGNRLKASEQLYLPNGQANTGLFSDEALQKKKSKSAFERACLADNRYSRLLSISEELDNDLENGKLSLEDYIYAKKNIQTRIDRAWKQISKARGWDEEINVDLEISIEENKTIENNSFTNLLGRIIITSIKPLLLWKSEGKKGFILEVIGELRQDNFIRVLCHKIGVI